MSRLGREKIMAGGNSGAGKTRAWLTMARKMSASKFVVLDADDGTEKVAKELGIPYRRMSKPYQLSPGVNLFPVYHHWSDFYEQASQIESWSESRVLTGDDWVIIEGLDIVCDNIKYEFAQGAYGSGTQGVSATRATGAHMAESSFQAFIARRRAGNPIIEPSDYDAIYTELQESINYLVLQSPTNVIATVGVQPPREGTYANGATARAESEWYASMGMPVRFAGWWKLPRKFDTLIVFDKSMGAGYTFQVFKDRGEQARGGTGSATTVPQRKPNIDFYQDYLVAMVGWEGQQTLAAVAPAPPRVPTPILPPIPGVVRA